MEDHCWTENLISCCTWSLMGPLHSEINNFHTVIYSISHFPLHNSKPLLCFNTHLTNWDPSYREGGSGAGEAAAAHPRSGGCLPACAFSLCLHLCAEPEDLLVDIPPGLRPSLSKQASVCREPAAKRALSTAERTCRGPGRCDMDICASSETLPSGRKGVRGEGGPGCLWLWNRPLPLLVTGHS